MKTKRPATALLPTDGIVRDTARDYLWPAQKGRLKVVPATLGELSQAIGAALVALYRA